MTLAVEQSRIQEVVGGLRRKLLINGEWVDAASGRTFETLNPATEQVIAHVAHGEREDVNRAVRAARAAFDDAAPWRRMSPGSAERLSTRLAI